MLLLIVVLADFFSVMMAAVAIVVAALIYLICTVARDRQWCHFTPVDPTWCLSRDPLWVRNILEACGVNTEPQSLYG